MFKHIYRFVAADAQGNEKELGFFQAYTGEEAIGKANVSARLQGINPWALLGVLVAAAYFRDQLPFRYEAWRLSHGLGAALLAKGEYEPKHSEKFTTTQ